MEVLKENVKLQKYPAYKDSGVEWLGEIPEHWEILPLYAVAQIRSEKNFPDLQLLSVYLDLGVIRFDDVEEKRTNVTSLDLSNYQKVCQGDFVLNNQQAWRGSVGVSNYEGIISPAYIVLKLSSKLNPGFANFLFRNSAMVSQYLMSSKGVGTIQRNLYWPQLRRTSISIPPLEEQTAIANFLDEKCGKIDSAIEQKQKLIELLKERKQIIIQELVTGKKVWNKEKNAWTEPVEVRDSGVEWIGEIPEHWEVKKIKHVTLKIGSGVTPSGGGTTYLEDGIPLLRSQNVHFGHIDVINAAKISSTVHDSMSNSKVKKGDVLLNITGGSIGRCHFIESDIPINVNQHVCIVRPNKEILTKFLNALLASEIGQGQIWFFQQGGGREGLNFQALKNFDIPYSPKYEQNEILDFLDVQVLKSDKTIALQQQQIEKLKEYKSSLIDAAVTGKIKVS